MNVIFCTISSLLLIICTPQKNDKDVKQEKFRNNLISGVETFDKEQGLKHTETDLKNPLPTSEGLLCFTIMF